MLGFILRWLINTLALVIVVGIIPGIEADRWQTVMIAALVLGFLNAILRPLLIFFTLPLFFISLGLVTLFINGLMLFLVSKIVEDFHVMSFASAFWGALVFSAVSFLLSSFIDPEGRVSVRFYDNKSFFKKRRDNVIDVEGHSDDES